MKKLIIAVAIVCVAVATQAATANWKASASNMYAGNSTDKYSGTAYIFDAGVMSQSALFAIFEAGTTIGSSTLGYAASAAITSGAMTATTFDYGTQSTSETTQNYSFYFAIIDNDKIYFSNAKDLAANGTATAKSIAFGTQNNGSTTFSAIAAADGFQGAGKWSAVPEPTSGLLMLLGMAGLALRRRRA